jgi:Bacterial SH3 domain
MTADPQTMLILRGISGHFAGQDWPRGALDEPPALEYARLRGYVGEVLDVDGATGPNSRQVCMCVEAIRDRDEITALYGFSGGGYNIRRVLAALSADERKRIKLVVVLGAPKNPPALYSNGSWELVYRRDPPAGHMAGPNALLAELTATARRPQLAATLPDARTFLLSHRDLSLLPRVRVSAAADSNSSIRRVQQETAQPASPGSVRALEGSTGMTTFIGPPSQAIRNKPISAELKQVLDTAARAAGIDTIRINSGGQDALGEGTRRTGSTRHDRGRAADLQCVVNGTTLTFTDQSAHPDIVAFVTAAAAAGATGIGAGVGYMGDRTIHVGFGASVNDHSKLTWGAGGRSANAPQWLRDAAAAGWSHAPVLAGAAFQTNAPGLYAVVARDGLKLRGGPGTNFESEKTLPAGTELNVVGTSNQDPSWVRVDLGGDGLLDGYVFGTFLAPVEINANHEGAPEPEGRNVS